MFLAQISDMHFRSHGRKLYDFIDVNGCNAEVVSQLNALEERPDAVVITGDIVNCGLPRIRRCSPYARKPALSAVYHSRQPR